MTTQIAFVNRSTLASDEECRLMAAACDIQLREHVRPAWEADLRKRKLPVDVPVVVCSPDAIPKGTWPIYVFDDADQLGYLGWHSVDDRGVPYGRIFVKAARAARWPLSVLGSHEAAEAFCDPYVDVYREGYALEVCDPVEGDTYGVSWDEGGNDEDGDDGEPATTRTLRVSNFALPPWFVGASAAGTRVDYLGKAKGPHQITPGGYVMTAGAVSAFAAGYPAWRVGAKLEPGSRTWRRAQAILSDDVGGS